MAKRGNNEGSITKRVDGRWMGRLALGNGKRQTVYGKTRAEVVRRLAEAVKAKEEHLPVVNNRRTVEQFLNKWLATVQPRLQPTTHARYEGLVRLQVIPEIGKYKLARLTAADLQSLYSTWRTRGLSATSVRHLHAVLHTALAQAARWDYVPRNVADLVVKPKMAARQMHPLTLEQATLLLDAAAGDRLEALYVVAVSAGLRQGELLALRWSNIEWDSGSLQVRGTMQPTREGLRIAEPKTKSSRRSVQLAPLAMDALKRHRSAQKVERLKVGEGWNHDLDLVFPNRFGQPMGAAVLLKGSFHPLLKRAGLPHMRFHELRHGAATYQLEAGTPAKVVSEMLGHSTIAITLDLYSHVTPTMQSRAAEVANDVLAGRARQGRSAG